MSGIATSVAWIQALTRVGIDFLYPPACPLCRRALEPMPQPAVRLCEVCCVAVSERGPYCARCGANVGPNLGTDGCMMCRGTRFHFSSVVRLGAYKDQLRSACLQMKQPGNESLAKVLADLVWDYESPAMRIAGIDLVVPVPHHWRQRWREGHTAPAILAEVWGGRLNVPVRPSIVRKIRWTVPQSALPPTTRRTNLRGAFAVARGIDLSGAAVLLADDVLTTGATAHEVAKVLRQAGARTVLAAVIARGVGHKPSPPQ